jgi:hypothetical protein
MTQPPEVQSLTPPQNSQTNGISKGRIVLPDPESVRRRAQEHLQRIEKERLEAAAERRAGREKGLLTKGLREPAGLQSAAAPSRPQAGRQIREGPPYPAHYPRLPRETDGGDPRSR